MTNDVDETVRGWIGTPFQHRACLKGVGADCLGLLRGVWRECHGDEPLDIPYYSQDWAEIGEGEPLLDAARLIMPETNLLNASTGDVLIFRIRRSARAKHIGFLSRSTAKDTTFIHSYARFGVVETSLSRPWRSRIAGVFKLTGRSM